MNPEKRIMMYMSPGEPTSNMDSRPGTGKEKTVNWENKVHPPLRTLLAPISGVYGAERFTTMVTTLETHSKRLNPAYQAWEYVRKLRATEVSSGGGIPMTGFEGFYCGFNWSGEAIMHDLDGFMTVIQNNIRQTYRGAIISFDTILGLLNGTTFDPQLLIVLTEHFGHAFQRKKRELTSIRSAIPGAEKKYSDFRADTYAAIDQLPVITHDLTSYTVGVPFTPEKSFITRPDPNTLPINWQVIEGIGKIGEPLFREAAACIPMGIYGPIRTRLRAGYQPDGGFPDSFRNNPWD